MPDYREIARADAAAEGVPEGMFERQINQESKFDPNAVSPSGAIGLAQIIPRFHPTVDPHDPIASLAYAAHWMAQLRATYGSWKRALMAYNWGPGNLEKWIARGADDSKIRAETRKYLDVILGDGWPEPDEGAPANNVRFEDFRDPEPAGLFGPKPLGIILHGSRSGRAGNPIESEYLGTARYEQSNTASLGWHATIGDGVVAIHLTPREYGWHARQASLRYLGVEFAQPTVDDAITDGQVAAFAAYVKKHVTPVYPDLTLEFPTHAEVDGTPVYGGTYDGKSDVFPKGDMRAAELRGRIARALHGTTPAPGPSDAYSVGSGVRSWMAEYDDGPIADSTFLPLGKSPAQIEAGYGRSGRTYLWSLDENRRLAAYEPDATE